jgi:hypothetical protein
MSTNDLLSLGLISIAGIWYVVPMVRVWFTTLETKQPSNCKAISVVRVTIQGKTYDLSTQEAKQIAEDMAMIINRSGGAT